MYARPAATGHHTGRMSSRDALNAITATLGTVMVVGFVVAMTPAVFGFIGGTEGDRKSTRLNSSYVAISYAVFCFNKNTIIERWVRYKCISIQTKDFYYYKRYN